MFYIKLICHVSGYASGSSVLQWHVMSTMMIIEPGDLLGVC